MKHLKRFGSKMYESASGMPSIDEVKQAMESGPVRAAAEKLTEAQLAKVLAGAADMVSRAEAGEFDDLQPSNERRSYKNSYRRINEASETVNELNRLSNWFSGAGFVGMIGGAAAAITMAIANGEYEIVPDAAKDGATDIAQLKPDFYSMIPGAIIFACGAISLLVGVVLAKRAEEVSYAQRTR